MPIYEYKCKECGEEFETLLTVSKHKKVLGCPACGGKKAVQQLSVPHAASWSSDWKFPNLAQEGDGTMTFNDRTEYENFLSEKGIVEVGGPGHPGEPGSRQKIVFGPRTQGPRKAMRGSW